eukprot:2346089-Rhodomonas_salina.3
MCYGKAGICLRARYAMSGTDVGYCTTTSFLSGERPKTQVRAAVATEVMSAISLRARYEMPGTDLV